MSVKVVSWNIAARVNKPWKELLEMEADVALLQEVGTVPAWVRDKAGVGIGPREHWDSHVWLAADNRCDRWPMVVRLSDRVEVEWLKQVAPFADVGAEEFAVSGIGTAAAARVVPRHGHGEPFVVVSMYGRWTRSHPTAKRRWGYPDGSVHGVISDLSAFIGSYDPATHRILAAGDLNVSFRSSDRFNEHAQTILDRMQVIGLEYVGPTYPHGRRATPVPAHLTETSLDVPTYHTNRRTPATAHVQLDHVFASRGFHDKVRTRALNRVDEWGGSDHCRVLIEVGDGEVATPVVALRDQHSWLGGA